MTGGAPLAASVVARARAGDLAGAIALGEEALDAGQGDAGLAMFTGMLRCRSGDLARGIVHLRRAVAMAPAEVPPKVELARALLSVGEVDDAAEIAAPLADTPGGAGREMRRVLALAQAGRDDRAAAALFEGLVRADPADFESWRGLGGARLRLADQAGAIVALSEATRLQPASPAAWGDLARAYAATHQPGQALAAAARGAAHSPEDAGAAIEHARALATLRRFAEAKTELARARTLADTAQAHVAIGEIAVSLRSPEAAEADYRRAITMAAKYEPAWRGLAALHERTNRPDAIRVVIEEAKAAGVDAAAMMLAEAWALSREGKGAEAEAVLLEMPEDGPDAVARDQLLGDLADRRGDVEAAFAAFSRANSRQAALEGTAEHAAEYRAQFDRLTEVITPEWFASWPAPPSNDARRAPLFVFGFPRSGTTLIDTLLGGHPDALVLEEEPTVERVSQAAQTIERVPLLTDREIRELRDLYFSEVEQVVGPVGDRLIVDKQPLALGSTPLLFRLFPDATFVFVERHPLDVVLSCFTMSSRMDAKVANFFDFESTARLYDAVLRFWTRCAEVLPIATMRARYERLLDDPQAEMRRLADFAGLSWDDRLLTNERNAHARGFIGSPSYAQVSQPIYTRARERWRRYRREMEPILPILRPWIEALGYPDPDG